MKREDRITEMEKILDNSNKSVYALKKAIDNFKKDEKDLLKLMNYYGSSTWLDDFDAYDEGKIDKRIKAGVLSEDLVYDLLVTYHEIVTEMSKIVSKALEENV